MFGSFAQLLRDIVMKQASNSSINLVHIFTKFKNIYFSFRLTNLMKVWHLLLNYWYLKLTVKFSLKLYYILVCLTCIKVLSWFLTSSGQLSRSLWSLVTLVLICLTSAVKESTVNLKKNKDIKNSTNIKQMF